LQQPLCAWCVVRVGRKMGTSDGARGSNFRSTNAEREPFGKGSRVAVLPHTKKMWEGQVGGLRGWLADVERLEQHATWSWVLGRMKL
jgi:hypothetical protein